MSPLRSAARLAGGVVLAVALFAAADGPAVGPAGAAGCSGGGCVQIAGSMEGNLSIRPGDWVSAGYQFSLLGNGSKNTPTVIGLDQAAVTIPVTCRGGGSRNIVIPLSSPGGDFASNPYQVPSNFGRWAPTDLLADGSATSGTEQSFSAYQGAVQVRDICDGRAMDSSHGATLFVPTIQWSQAPVPKITIQFHYRDPHAKGEANLDCASPTANPQPGSRAACGAQWSGTSSVVPTINSGNLPSGAAVGVIAGGVVIAGGIVLFALRWGTRRRPPRS